jgi:serine/threonine protein kinase
VTFPILNDYKAAMNNAKARFATLDITPRLDGRRSPLFLAGNFAGVFKAERPDGTLLAVKCFIRDLPNLERRYQAVARFISAAGSPYFIDLTYHPAEVYVTSTIATAGEFPVVTMPWIDGRTIGAVAGALCEKNNRRALAGLGRAWARLCRDLLGRGIAHGDLKHDNVLVTPEGRLKLIDYDSMFLPELQGLASPLLGGINFQNPARTDRHYDDSVDHFSMLVMLLSLRALVHDPSLLAKYHNGENIILSHQDFVTPTASPLLQLLLNSDDFFLADWSGRLVAACRTGALRVPGMRAILRAALKLDVNVEPGGPRRLFYLLTAGGRHHAAGRLK